MYTFFNTEFLPAEDTRIHVSDLATQRGYAAFDFLKVTQGKPLFIQDYLDRFERSASLMRLPMPFQREALTNIIHELIAKNGVPEAGLKLILTGGYSSDGYEIATPNLMIIQQPLTLPSQSYIEKGVKVITHEHIRDLPEVKSINYIMGIWLLQQIREAQAADVLYHMNGVVSEFPRCNVFVVREDGVVVTPGKRVLEGITRKNILRMHGKSHTIIEGQVSMQDLLQAKEVFLTSTTKRIVPIVQVDNSPIANGKPGTVTLSLLEELIDVEKSEILNLPSLKFVN